MRQKPAAVKQRLLDLKVSGLLRHHSTAHHNTAAAPSPQPPRHITCCDGSDDSVTTPRGARAPMVTLARGHCCVQYGDVWGVVGGGWWWGVGEEVAWGGR